MKKHRSSLAVGFPTIVNLLLLLAFTCLALLSLSRAKADQMAAGGFPAGISRRTAALSSFLVRWKKLLPCRPARQALRLKLGSMTKGLPHFMTRQQHCCLLPCLLARLGHCKSRCICCQMGLKLPNGGWRLMDKQIHKPDVISCWDNCVR